MASKKHTFEGRTQVQILKSTPSPLFLAAHLRHAGAHADQERRTDPQQRRRQNRREERDARLGFYGEE
jgi:hypothetical protein